MARKEVTVKHSDISNSQTITKVVEQAFKEAGLDAHRHECTHEDDHRAGKRIYKIKNVKYFGNWSHRG